MEVADRTRHMVLLLALLLLAGMTLVNLMNNVAQVRLPAGEALEALPTPKLGFFSEPAGSTTYLLATVLALLGGGLIAYLYWRFRPRGGIPYEELLILAAVAMAVLVLLTVVAALDPVAPTDEDPEEPGGEDPGEPGTDPGDEQGEPGNEMPLFRFGELRLDARSVALLVLAFVILSITFALVRILGLRRMQRGGPAYRSPELKRQEEAARTVERGLYRLRRGHEFRSVILECYHELVSVYREEGVEVRPSQTPREVEADALQRLPVSPEANRVLRTLFERVRYSPYPGMEEDRRTALTALERVRAELGG